MEKNLNVDRMIFLANMKYWAEMTATRSSCILRQYFANSSISLLEWFYWMNLWSIRTTNTQSRVQIGIAYPGVQGLRLQHITVNHSVKFVKTETVGISSILNQTGTQKYNKNAWIHRQLN